MKANLPRIGLFVVCLVISGCTPERTPLPSDTPSTPAIEPTIALTDTPISPTTILPAQMAVIFDDDGSPDGTTALLYLLSHPAVELKAINVSFGEAHPAIYIQHIGRKLDDFGIEGIPLGAGQDAPLAGTNFFPEGMRQMANNFWGLPLPKSDRTLPVQDAAELIVAVIHQSPEPVTVFVSGPCTNLAQALRLDPGIKDHIAAVYIMGGAVYVPGNINDIIPDTANAVAEWNIYADPQAAKEVFESGLKIYLVPLDATDQVQVSSKDTRQWRAGGPVADFAADIYDMLLKNWGVQNAAIWDLMTAAIMVQPELCKFQPLHLQVITDEGNTSGQTAVVQGAEPNANVCLEPQTTLILETLSDVFTSAPAIPTFTPVAATTDTVESATTTIPTADLAGLFDYFEITKP